MTTHACVDVTTCTANHTWVSSEIELLRFFLVRLVTRYRICQKMGDANISSKSTGKAGRNPCTFKTQRGGGGGGARGDVSELEKRRGDVFRKLQTSYWYNTGKDKDKDKDSGQSIAPKFESSMGIVHRYTCSLGAKAPWVQNVSGVEGELASLFSVHQ